MAEAEIGGVRLVARDNILTVSFTESDQGYAELSTHEVDDLINFVLSMSRNELNRRNAFRVPVRDASGLSVEVHHNDFHQIIPVRNISMTGMCINRDRVLTKSLTLDDALVLTIRYMDKEETLAGVVRRLDTETIGIGFDDTVSSGSSRASSFIQKIVMGIQREWLAR